ncbi:MAG: hypothetical protein R2769_15680 [Saprospiraceae bacterium]
MHQAIEGFSNQYFYMGN